MKLPRNDGSRRFWLGTLVLYGGAFLLVLVLLALGILGRMSESLEAEPGREIRDEIDELNLDLGDEIR